MMIKSGTKFIGKSKELDKKLKQAIEKAKQQESHKDIQLYQTLVAT
jgi:hypothetical protein